MIRFLAHYGIHFIVPILITFYFYKDNRVWVAIILLSGILIDVDHILANPMFDPNRCSINFHPLHNYWAIALYIVLFSIKKTRVFGLAFLLHILADIVDCLFIHSEF
ncbi:DUF6122 family protein [Maribacter sp. ACAM166]|uniref:DUF6122 family protein n=1 Tax=Maribacter sp. ACAM166 TaxID=2508996 RepID=UPI0010FEADD1|nr:DUF6122 family protein [Maribacter sp. ACAM166]TLP80578.1 hypothetical protein ES765_07360 [Maribacter sp. ACAM166]